MITLPLTPRNRPTFRILTMPEGSWASQTWSELPIPAIISRKLGVVMGGTVMQGGFHVKSISRWCLPDEDRADFYIDTGLINGAQVAAIDLSNMAIRIQVLDDETFPAQLETVPSTGWKTVFVGTVIYTRNEKQVGIRDSGRTTYFCAGTLWRTRNWPLDRHATAGANHAKGHPGYNSPLHGWFRKVLGNRSAEEDARATDPFGDIPVSMRDYYWRHALPLDGNGNKTTKWTDEQVIQHALVSSRATGEPLIRTNLTNGLFAGSYAWGVSTGDTCWDLLRRICNRQRGRGSVYLDYTDSDSAKGDVTLTLRARASMPSSLTYAAVPEVTTYGFTQPSGSLEMSLNKVIVGAEHGIDAIDVDINGDHRITESGLQYDNRASSVFDGITVQGENIRVLCNMNFFGSSLVARWSHDFAESDETLFDAIAVDRPKQRTLPRWSQVYRRYGPPSTWDFKVTAEKGGTVYPINYHTTEHGDIEEASGVGLSSIMTFKILPDLPIYEGWRYDNATPSRFDAAADYLPPATGRPVVMYRGDTDATGGKPAWLPLQNGGFNLQFDDFGMLIVHGEEERTGFRMLMPVDSVTAHPGRNIPFSKVGIEGISTASGIDRDKLNTIVGVELGTRVSMFKHVGDTGAVTYESAGRRMTMTINGLHLWLGAPGAIWELDYLNAATNSYPPGLKFPTTQEAYVIRDDRNELSFIATLAWEYYGRVHNPATWGLKDCGLMTQFSTQNGPVAYPKLGQLVGTITYAGPQDGQSDVTINTPITSIHYDHDACETTWRTDYVSYDGNIQ